MRSLLLTLLPTVALIAAEPGAGCAIWDAGAGMLGAEPGMRGASVRPGTVIVVSADGPVRVILPGTAHGHLTLAAGSTVTLAERRVGGNGATTAELLITIAAGAVAVGGDIAPRFAAVRLRGGASETVAAPGVGVVVETDRVVGDTVVAIDGPVGTGPLPGRANGWQAVAERVTLAQRTMVVVDPQRGVGEPAPAPARPQLAGPAAIRTGVRAQVMAAASSVEAWAFDAAARDLGPADPAWWTAPPAGAGATEAKPWSVMVQFSGFCDSNPNGVATQLGGGTADVAGSVFGDVRWGCGTSDDSTLRFQVIGGLVRYHGVRQVDDAGVQRDSRDKDQRQAGMNVALVQGGGIVDWSVGVGGAAYADDRQYRRAFNLHGDVGCQVLEDGYAVLNLGVAHSRIDPSDSGTVDYKTRGVTARPALTVGLPGTAWFTSLEVSLLCTDSSSAVAADDFRAVRPGVSCTSTLGRLDLGLSARCEFIAYRAPRAATETTLARETVVQTTATADWRTTTWSSVGLFGNHVWFDSNQPLADYSQVQVGVRSTLNW